MDLQTLGAGVMGAFVVASAVVFGALVLKSRSIRSFSFQFSIFMLLWAAAELPEVLSTLGVVNTSGFQDLGLELHLSSMFVFGAFVVFRGRTIFGEMRLNQLVQKATYSSVSKVIDDGGARALGFYVDYEMLGRDPGLFDAMLRKVFASGADIIENNIVEELFQASGMQRDPAAKHDFVAELGRVAAVAKRI